MKILILNGEIPWPVNQGNIMRTWLFINALKGGHELSLLCRDKIKEGEKAKQLKVHELKKTFKNVWAVAPENVQSLSFGKRLQNFVSGTPWYVKNTYCERFNQKFLEVAGTYGFDVIICRYIDQGQFIIRNKNKISSRAVLDIDDIETIRSKRLTQNHKYKGFYDEIRTKIDSRLLENYHKRLNTFDHCTVCSEHDREVVFNNSWSKNINVVPNGINVKQYARVTDYSSSVSQMRNLLCVGTLNYAPNVDGILWFMKKVFPRIRRECKDVKLTLVGKSPNEVLYEQSRGLPVEIHANVPDVNVYYDQASAVVVPLLSGGGTRIKILEALACRRPVVATSIGAEGLSLSNHENCLIADTESEFSNACVKLLKDTALAVSMAKKGFLLVNESYDVPIIEKKIRGVIHG